MPTRVPSNPNEDPVQKYVAGNFVYKNDKTVGIGSSSSRSVAYLCVLYTSCDKQMQLKRIETFLKILYNGSSKHTKDTKLLQI